MAHYIRIVLVQQNRYDALLIEREISHRIGDSIVTVYRSVDEALPDIRHTRYDLAIVDYSLCSDSPGEELQKIRGLDDTLPMILLVDNGSTSVANDILKIGISKIVPKAESYHLVLPPLIIRLNRNRIHGYVAPPVRAAEVLAADGDPVAWNVSQLEDEVNNPLMTILGITELILDHKEDLPKPLERKMQIIRRSGRRIQRALSKLSRQSRSPECESVQCLAKNCD